MAAVIIFTLILIAAAVSAADVEMEGVLGETFILHGTSYVGDYVYLFMTGPGLPENGVTLTNVDQRADQGQFTVVAVDNNQEWSYTWKTSRIANEIDPGTYTVYVTNQKADKAHLGGSSSYKTYSFFLKDSGESKVSINAEHSYTLNPEEHVSTIRPVPPVNLTTVATTASPVTTAAIPATTAPTTRAAPGIGAVLSVIGAGTSLVVLKKVRR